MQPALICSPPAISKKNMIIHLLTVLRTQYIQTQMCRTSSFIYKDHMNKGACSFAWSLSIKHASPPFPQLKESLQNGENIMHWKPFKSVLYDFLVINWTEYCQHASPQAKRVETGGPILFSTPSPLPRDTVVLKRHALHTAEVVEKGTWAVLNIYSYLPVWLRAIYGSPWTDTTSFGSVWPRKGKRRQALQWGDRIWHLPLLLYPPLMPPPHPLFLLFAQLCFPLCQFHASSWLTGSVELLAAAQAKWLTPSEPITQKQKSLPQSRALLCVSSPVQNRIGLLLI